VCSSCLLEGNHRNHEWVIHVPVRYHCLKAHMYVSVVDIISQSLYTCRGSEALGVPTYFSWPLPDPKRNCIFYSIQFTMFTLDT
jgi:hypothetical protein